MSNSHVGSSEITSIKRESAAEQVFQQMKTLIDTRVWKPGMRIPSENQLSQDFGVSRMTVRSATQKLKTMGLLDVYPGNGSFVKAITLESYMFGPDSSTVMPNALSDAFSLRYYLEQAAVELFIENASDAEIEELGRKLEQLEASASKNSPSFRDDDIAFHRYIYVTSKNRLLLTIFDMTEPLLRAQIDKFDGQVQDLLELETGRRDFHTRLYEAISARDFDSCRKHLSWYRQAEEACSENALIEGFAV